MPLKTYHICNYTDETENLIALYVGHTQVADYEFFFERLHLYHLEYMMYVLPVLTEIAQYRTHSSTICVDKFTSILEGRGWTKC